MFAIFINIGGINLKEKNVLDDKIEKGNFSKGGEASSKLKKILRKLGVEASLIRKTSIVTYELEMNVIIHSEGGKITVTITTSEINILVEDKGPGIEDLDKAFQAGYSTASEEIREMGFGAGMGLNNVRKYADKLNVETGSGEGTRIEAVILL